MSSGFSMDRDFAARAAKAIEWVERHRAGEKPPSRPPGQMLFSPKQEITIKAGTSRTIPPFGVVAFEGGYLRGETADITQTSYGYYPQIGCTHVFFAVGNQTLAAAQSGRGHIIESTPLQIRVHPDLIGTPKIGDAIGLLPSTLGTAYRWVCGIGLPPFRVAWNVVGDTTDDGKWLWATMSHDADHWWARAYETWTVDANTGMAEVMARPCTDETGDRAYDGTDDYPAINLRIILPRGPGRDPNVRAGDVFRYSYLPHYWTADQRSPQPYFMAVGPEYLDDKLGTVKMWTGDPADVPAGWELYAPMHNRFPKGDNSGALTIGSFGSAGSGYTFMTTRFIRRIA